MRAGGGRESDIAFACLKELAAVSGELNGSARRFTESIAAGELPEGVAYREVFPLRKRLEIIERISNALREINRHGHLFRRVEAHTLYAEGLTMAQLASVFGVSRQRVSALLREPVDTPGASGPAEGPAGAPGREST
jgi:hypothetical protein